MATNVKLERTIFNAWENVLANTVLKYLIQYVARMEKPTATNVKLERKMSSVRENVLANTVLK